MSAVSGIISDCEIRVTDTNGATLKFSGLNIIINKSLPDTEVESSSEFTALQEAISKTASMVEHTTLKNNPHEVTVDQIGAAKANHSHDFDNINNTPTTLDGYGITDAVSNTLTINNKDLSDDIILTANDINAATIEQGNKADTAIQNAEKGKANGVATLDSNSKLVRLPTPEDIKAVPTSRTVNSKPLSSDIILSASDVGALPDTTSIPSKISDLQNDSGFITEYIETDPTVPSWAKATNKPEYSFFEINNTPTTLNGYGITNAVPLSRTINSKALSTNIILTPSDIGLDIVSGNISHGQVIYLTPQIRILKNLATLLFYIYISNYHQTLLAQKQQFVLCQVVLLLQVVKYVVYLFHKGYGMLNLLLIAI